MKTELLAPAGDIEAGYAALYYGADAVYLGLKHFSARATATNFDAAELNNFVGYAHHLKRRVYVTINTLVQENELPSLIDSLDTCSNCGVDGIILQDLGVARIIKSQYPELELHASTQMAVHNKQGALALQKLGFKRVVLARELSLAEIKDIASIPNLETEAFIHGALCYSYSGLCMFSSLESGRSANRGKCLYPCRSVFSGKSGDKHYFSMKDMALQDEVRKMPVTSLKIEGRKKNALYVAAVTDYYRNILDGKGAIAQKEENIKQIFSRPWCKFMLHGKDKSVVDRDFVGHRGLPIGKVLQIVNGKLIFKPNHKIARHDGLQIDIAGQEKPFGFSIQNMSVNGRRVFEANAKDEVSISLPPKSPDIAKGQNIYLASSSEVKGGYNYTHPKDGEYIRRHDIEVEVKVTSDNISAFCGNFSAEIEGNFAKAEDAGKTNDAATKAFNKTGDTELSLKELHLINPDGLFVPASMFNELRRKLYAKISFDSKHGNLPPAIKACAHQQSKWIVRTDNAENLALLDFDKLAEIEFLLSRETKVADISNFPKNKVRLVLPALARDAVAWKNSISAFLSAGYKKWTIGNWWGLDLLPEQGIDLSFDTSLYTLNTQAISMAKEIGANRVCLSFEDTSNNMRTVAQESPLPVVLPVYSDVPLFSSAVCIRDNPCSQCPKGSRWIELHQEKTTYWALSRNCQTFVFDDRPLCFAAEAGEVKADFLRADFCYKNYSAQQVLQIFEQISAFKDVTDCAKGNINSLVI